MPIRHPHYSIFRGLAEPICALICDENDRESRTTGEQWQVYRGTERGKEASNGSAF